MTIDEIAIAFQNCNGDSNRFFKEYRATLLSIPTSGITVTDATNYILKDVEQLLNKALLNIVTSDQQLKEGHFSWGLVSSYYVSFFSIQALNRLQLNFTSHDFKCMSLNYYNQEILIKKITSSNNSHSAQFDEWEANKKEYAKTKNIDRFWTIGLDKYEYLTGYKSEPDLRNNINYFLSKNSYYELDLQLPVFKKIIDDNKSNPFSISNEQIEEPLNYARKQLKISIARVRCLIYVLNHLAKKNVEYTSYYERNMNVRKSQIEKKYPNTSQWITDLLFSWLQLLP